MACVFIPCRATSIIHTPSPLNPVENSLKLYVERERVKRACVRCALEEIYSNTKHTAMSWQDPRAATVEKS